MTSKTKDALRLFQGKLVNYVFVVIGCFVDDTGDLATNLMERIEQTYQE